MQLLSQSDAPRSRWQQFPRISHVHKLFALALLTLLFTGILFHQPPSLSNMYYNNDHTQTSQSTAIAQGMPLRLMFMGASITRGEVSAGDRGYRKQIRDWLVSLGNSVNCVGTNRFGDFPDNDVEGWGASMIKMLLEEHVRKDLPAIQPNLILMQVGTSDCFRRADDDPAYIILRMRELMDYIFEVANSTTVIMSTIVTTPNKEVERCVLTANAQIRQVANDLMREGKRVVMAEMHYNQGLPGRPEPKDIGLDQIHPTNEGYAMMGEVFKEKIREVDKLGFLQRPVENGIPDNGEAERMEEERQRLKQSVAARMSPDGD